jgi:hypothetical protein
MRQFSSFLPEQTDDFLNAPHVIAHARFHGWRQPQRL